MTLHRGYEPARRCTGSATPGCKALMSWYLAEFGRLGGVNTGIYNCREVRGGGAWSLHAEGRGADLGVRPYSAQYGTDLAEKLRLNSGELGIQLIIWNRRSWSGSRPDAGWRPYNGVSAHTDHLHVELSWATARGLTVERIRAVLSGGGGSSGSTIQRGSTGDAVRKVQDFMGIPVTDVFDAETEKVVRAYQQDSGLDADGVVGPATWKRLEQDMSKIDDIHHEVTFRLPNRRGDGSEWGDSTLGYATNGDAHSWHAWKILEDVVTRLERIEEAVKAPKAP